MITLCLCAKAGVDVLSTATDSDTLMDRFNHVRETVCIADLRTQTEARSVLAEMIEDMNVRADSLDARQSLLL